MLGNSSVVLSRVLGRGGSCFPDQAQHFQKRDLLHPLPSEWRRPGQQFVEKDAERIDVAAGVDVELIQLGLLRAHVLGRADHRAEAGEQRLVGELRPGRLGDAEVDDLGHGPAVVHARRECSTA